MKTATGSALRLGLVVFGLYLLMSCGGGGGGGETPATPATLTGIFIDSPVQGLPYSAAPSGLSGLTGPNGEFQYRSGDGVEFRIGGMPITEVSGQPQLTPFTLLGTTTVPSVTHVGPVNLARLLLALDTVPGTETITLPTTLPTVPEHFTSPTFAAAAQTAGISLVSEASAIAHLKSQFAIWGSWATAGTPSELQVSTFLPDGTFILAHDADLLMAGSVDGMERGTYRWNATTNELTFTVAVNTDGTGGLSHPSTSQTPPYTFVIDPSGDSAAFHFGPNVNDQVFLTRVTDAATLRVGAWKLKVPFDLGFTAVLTLSANGTFTVASDPIDSDPAGMERGTYVVDQATGNVTFTTTVDTNGEFGINDSPMLPAVVTLYTQVSSAIGGDFDFLQIDEPEGTVFFDRIRVP